MELYFDILPSELNNIILSYLHYKELIDLNNIVKINYEELFAIRFPKEYRDIKNIFRIDKTLEKYKNKWDVFYIGYIGLGNMDIVSIVSDVYYTVKIYDKYKDFFWIKENLLHKGLNFDKLTYYIYNMLKTLEDLQELNKILTIESLNDIRYEYISLYISETSITYALICFVFFDRPQNNFGLSVNELIEKLKLGISELYMLQWPDLEDGDTEYAIYQNIIDVAKKYVEKNELKK